MTTPQDSCTEGGERIDHQVSIILPSYDDSNLALTAIESVRDQTYNQWNLLLVDGSDARRLRNLEARDDRIEHHFREPTGIADARNYGVEQATGEYVAFLDADDEWLPEKLERQIAATESGADFVYTDIHIVEDGTERRQSSLPIRDATTHQVAFFREGGIPSSSVLVRRSFLGDERFITRLDTGEDRHMWVRLLRECEPVRIAEPLVRYRRREGSLTDDIFQMYEDEQWIVNDLANQFTELEPYRAELLAKAEYKLAKRLLRQGKASEARSRLRAAIKGGFLDRRPMALLPVAYSPLGQARLLRVLERLDERL